MTVQGHSYDDNVGAPVNRNRIINGSFAIDQRNAGAAQTITAAAALAYTTDRWYSYCTGANVTGQRIAGTAPFQYNYRFTGAASNTAIGFGTRLEAADTIYLAGGTAMLSAYVASSSLTSLTWNAYYASSVDSFGTVASPTRTQIATGSFTVSSTLTRRSVSFSVPSAAVTGIEVVFTTGALTATNTFTFAGVQLEAGPVATPFEFEPFETTLRKCQRYFLAWGGEQVYNIVALGFGLSTTAAQFMLQHPVQMRAIPALSTSGSFQISDGATAPVSTGHTLNITQSSTKISNFTSTAASGLTQFRFVRLESANSATALFFLSAEL